MKSALLHPSSSRTVVAKAIKMLTKMLVLRARPRPLGQYGAMVGNERRDLGLIADQCPPLSRLHEAVAYHGHILQKAMASDCQHELEAD